MNFNALQTAIELHFDTGNVPSPQDITHKYNLTSLTVNADFYDQSSDRFMSTHTHGILYRPDITNRICSRIEHLLISEEIRSPGIMIKGPQGIGKSHTLVDVIRKLRSTGNYLVTVLPDCGDWELTLYLVDAICASFGTQTYTNLGLPFFTFGREAFEARDLYEFINAVDTILQNIGKQWVFVFDQINSLFSRHLDCTNVGNLPFPFRAIALARRRHRIISVISASANNEMSYKDSHPGFEEFIHPPCLTKDEAQSLYNDGQLSRYEQNYIETMTGFVPLYLRMLLIDNYLSENLFHDDVKLNVLYLLGKLREKKKDDDWSKFSDNMCLILLGCNFKEKILNYDRNFFVDEYDAHRHITHYRPLSVLVEDATRDYFRKTLWNYVATHESHLLQVFHDTNTTTDTKGRIFEGLVIQRCQTNQVSVEIHETIPVVHIVARVFDVGGQQLPVGNMNDGVHVPVNCNFPAVDMIWKVDNRVFGVQIHVNRGHRNVVEQFWDMCRAAGWFQKYEEIFLLYLSPNENCAIHDKDKIPLFTKTVGRTLCSNPSELLESHQICVQYITIDSVNCLKDIDIPRTTTI